MMTVQPAELQGWFPVCAGHDLPPKHVMEAGLLGRDLAVWRGRSGKVNVWENRCPHRGMRLTVGANLGDGLRCAYHGYRFADGSGLCTSIPAQPDRQPPRSVCATPYATLERGDLVWARLASDETVPPPPIPEDTAAMAMYGVPVRCAASAVAAALSSYRFRPCAALAEPESADEQCTTSALSPYGFRSVATKQHMITEVRLFLQPVDEHCTVVHAVLLGEVPEALRIPTLRHHAAQLTRLRESVERVAAAAARSGAAP